ncbi:probable phospholipid hydroperoxide glutathione peroxidase [Hyposmocoma kahamanoa]|uniref:probable phospholipid hydroperoxide glutathione peroxidase n=1 Tax=Hyposmocoma kahamanoa TaxID=1477025 RepID=UPI000E6D810E|nr:probable phospholipid hydroperoxide glutathione peroxidase [Hyposmocoma kahamanoa]
METNVPLSNPDYDQVKSVHEFQARSLKGEIIRLEYYKGYVCIIVNIATRSRMTDNNFDAFNMLYEIYFPYGLRILGFPCNQFDNEEPGDDFEIMRYAAKKNVKWDIFKKTDVNGPTACELFKFLKHEAPGPRVRGESSTLVIKSNYTKFIINRAGIPDQRLPPNADFKMMEKALLPYLGLNEPVKPLDFKAPDLQSTDLSKVGENSSSVN